MSSSSPQSPEPFQVWIRLHPFPNNIFGLPPIVHNGKQRLWLTRFIAHGSTGSVWKCHLLSKLSRCSDPPTQKLENAFVMSLRSTLSWRKHINLGSCRIASLRVVTAHMKVKTLMF